MLLPESAPFVAARPDDPSLGATPSSSLCCRPTSHVSHSTPRLLFVRRVGVRGGRGELFTQLAYDAHKTIDRYNMMTGYTVQPQHLYFAVRLFSSTKQTSPPRSRLCGCVRCIVHSSGLAVVLIASARACSSYMRAETFFPLRLADGGMVGSSPLFDAAATRPAGSVPFRWFIAVAIAADDA